MDSDRHKAPTFTFPFCPFEIIKRKVRSNPTDSRGHARKLTQLLGSICWLSEPIAITSVGERGPLLGSCSCYRRTNYTAFISDANASQITTIKWLVVFYYFVRRKVNQTCGNSFELPGPIRRQEVSVTSLELRQTKNAVSGLLYAWLLVRYPFPRAVVPKVIGQHSAWIIPFWHIPIPLPFSSIRNRTTRLGNER